MNREVIGNNANGGAGSDVLTEFCYIDRTHPDTAIARRASQKALLRSSVNIDAPLEGIAIALFGTLQRMRVTIGSRPVMFGLRISPVGERDLKTSPRGCPIPIFAFTVSFPKGVA